MEHNNIPDGMSYSSNFDERKVLLTKTGLPNGWKSVLLKMSLESVGPTGLHFVSTLITSQEVGRLYKEKDKGELKTSESL